jgi:hypothetical protein
MDVQPKSTTRLIAATLVTGTTVWVDLVWSEPDPVTGLQAVKAILPMTDESLREHWRRGGLQPRAYELSIGRNRIEPSTLR